MRKLLIIAHSLYKSGQMYDKEFIKHGINNSSQTKEDKLVA